MDCYKCGSKLDTARNSCTKCGANIRLFKKIVYASNRYYNEGLMKAQGRDLTGAREALRTSLQIYKKNTNARNLLGLVEYAMGESAEGLKQWVLSKNINEKNSMADRYINYMKRNVRDLNSENHGIKKYNQALEYARTGSRDLATIQLKKVVSVHANMVKAYELLALLYIDDGKYDQAKKVLYRCLEVDRGNLSALHYLKELETMPGQRDARSIGVVGEEEREQLIIPVRFRDYGTYLTNALYILLGAALGIAVAWFVIVPGKVQKETGIVKGQERSYEAEIASLTEQLAREEAAAANDKASDEAETSEQEASSEEAEEAGNEGAESGTETVNPFLPQIPERISSWKQNQNAITETVAAFNEQRWLDLARGFFSVDPTQLSRTLQGHYENLIVIVTDMGVYQTVMEGGNAAFEDGRFEEALSFYEAAALMHPEEAEPRYRAGLSCEALERAEEASNYFLQIARIYPEYEAADECTEKYLNITGKKRVPKLAEGLDAVALRKALDREEMMSEMLGRPWTMEESTVPETVPEETLPEETAPEGEASGEVPAEPGQPAEEAPEDPGAPAL